MTELRDGRIVGVRTAAGRVLVPPMEYDTDGEAVTDEFVAVGPAGVVKAWSWVSRPRSGQPLDRPFVWALIALEGADTALLHVIDFGQAEPGAKPPRELRAGLTVRPRWRAERVGSIRDIESFRPDVTMISAPSRLDYKLQAGQALGRFLEGVAEGRFLGQRCGVCGKVYVPMKGLCPADGVPTTEEIEVAGTGTITTFAVNNIPDPRAPEVPFVSAYILLDGADIAWLALVAGVPADQVRMGMRVRAVWRPREEWGRTMANVRWFEPIDEPDVSFDDIKDYL